MTVVIDVSVKVVHHGINIMQQEVFECRFRASSSPGVQGEAKNTGAEGAVEVVQHFAVVAGFVIKFGASRRGLAVVDHHTNSGSGERVSTEDSLGFKIVIVEANDVTGSTGHCADNGPISGHPTFCWEGIDGGRKGRFWLMFWHVDGVCGRVCVNKHGG